MTTEQGHVRELARGASLATGGRFAGRLVGAIGDIVAARALGPALFGIYSIGWTIFRLVELVAPLGLDMGIIRFAARHFGKDDVELSRVVRGALLGTLSISLPLAVLFYAAAPFLAESVFHKPQLESVVRLFCWAFPLAGLLAVLAASTRLTHRMAYTVALQDFGQPLLALLFLAAFLIAGAGLRGVILSDVGSYAIVVLLGFYFLVRLFPTALRVPATFQLAPPPGLIAFSATAASIGVLTTLVFWVDRLLIGYFLPASASGVYQAVSQISVIFVVVQSGLNRIVIPMLVTYSDENKQQQLEDVYRISTKWGLYISVPAFVVLVLAPREVLLVTYGGDYTSGALLVLVLLVGQLANLATGPVGPLLIATGHQNITLLLSGGCLALNITLNVLLVPQLGLVGAAISTSASLTLFYVAALLAARVRLQLWPYDARYWRGAVAALAALLATRLAQHLSLASSTFSLLVLLAVAFSVFFVMLLIMRLDPEDIELLKSLRGRLPRRRAYARQN